MTTTRLLLFDIDGTLVNTGGAGVEALKLIVHNRFSAKDDLRDIEIGAQLEQVDSCERLTNGRTSEPKKTTSRAFLKVP